MKFVIAPCLLNARKPQNIVFPQTLFAVPTFEVLSLALQHFFRKTPRDRSTIGSCLGLKVSFTLFSSVPVALSHCFSVKSFTALKQEGIETNTIRSHLHFYFN